MCGVHSFFSIPFHLLLDNMKLRKDMIAQNLLPLPLVEMFTTNGDLEDQDHAHLCKQSITRPTIKGRCSIVGMQLIRNIFANLQFQVKPIALKT